MAIFSHYTRTPSKLLWKASDLHKNCKFKTTQGKVGKGERGREGGDRECNSLPVGEQGQQEENTRQNVCTSNNTRNLRKSNKVKSCKTIMLEDINVQHVQDIPDNKI